MHVATRVTECDPKFYFSEAPWRIELPQGGVIRGVGNQGVGAWPEPLNVLPPNRTIVRTGGSGTGKVVEDNAGAIDDMLASYNADVESGTAEGGAPAAGGAGPAGATGSTKAGAPGATPTASAASGGCAVSAGRAPFGAAVIAGALGAVLLRRRRRR